MNEFPTVSQLPYSQALQVYRATGAPVSCPIGGKIDLMMILRMTLQGQGIDISVQPQAFIFEMVNRPTVSFSAEHFNLHNINPDFMYIDLFGFLHVKKGFEKYFPTDGYRVCILAKSTYHNPSTVEQFTEPNISYTLDITITN